MAQIITYNPQPYSYIQTIADGSVYSLPTGYIHFNIKKVTDVAKAIVDHNWYAEIKYSNFLSLYATTDDVFEYYEESKPSKLLVKISGGGIQLENNIGSSLNLMITILQ